MLVTLYHYYPAPTELGVDIIVAMVTAIKVNFIITMNINKRLAVYADIVNWPEKKRRFTPLPCTVYKHCELA